MVWFFSDPALLDASQMCFRGDRGDKILLQFDCGMSPTSCVLNTWLSADGNALGGCVPLGDGVQWKWIYGGWALRAVSWPHLWWELDL